MSKLEYKSASCVIKLQPGESVSLICGVKEGLSGFVSAFTSLQDYLYLRLEQSPAIVKKGDPPQTPDGVVAVQMEDEEERIPAATEEIQVPKGVKIKVKRSRSVEHTLEVDWTIAGEARLEAGFRQVLSGSIRGEISQKQGRSTTESETIEYEVELVGEQACRYQLKWTDIWRKGVAKFAHDGITHMAPFKYKERSELEVVPMAENA